jgi:hypothetical protein
LKVSIGIIIGLVVAGAVYFNFSTCRFEWSGPHAMITEEVTNPDTGNKTARVVSSAPFDCNTTIYVHDIPSLLYGRALLECRNGTWQFSAAPVTPAPTQ